LDRRRRRARVRRSLLTSRRLRRLQVGYAEDESVGVLTADPGLLWAAWQLLADAVHGLAALALDARGMEASTEHTALSTIAAVVFVSLWVTVVVAGLSALIPALGAAVAPPCAPLYWPPCFAPS